MTSALFTVNGSSSQTGHTFAYGASVPLALVSTANARKITWEVVAGSKADEALPTIVSAGTSATLTLPSDPGDPLGRAYLVRCTVNDGRNALGVADSSLVVQRLIGTVNDSALLPLVPGETTERHATAGWTPAFNQGLAGVGGAVIPAPADPDDDGKIAVAEGGAWSVGDSGIPRLSGRDGSLILRAGTTGDDADSLLSLTSVLLRLQRANVEVVRSVDGRTTVGGEEALWLNVSGADIKLDSTLTAAAAADKVVVFSTSDTLTARSGSAVASTPDSMPSTSTTDATPKVLTRVNVPPNTWVEVGVLVRAAVSPAPYALRSLNVMAYRDASAPYAVTVEALDGFASGNNSPTLTAQANATAVSDAAWSAVGFVATITSAGGNLPTVAVGDTVDITDHSVSAYNGRYTIQAVTAGTSWTATRSSGAPSTAAAEAVTIGTGVDIVVTGVAATTIAWSGEVQTKQRAV